MKYFKLCMVSLMIVSQIASAANSGSLFKGSYRDFLSVDICPVSQSGDEFSFYISYKNDSEFVIDFLPSDLGLSKRSSADFAIYYLDEKMNKHAFEAVNAGVSEPLFHRVESRLLLYPGEQVHREVPVSRYFKIKKSKPVELEYTFSFGVKSKSISWSGTVVVELKPHEECYSGLKLKEGVYSKK